MASGRACLQCWSKYNGPKVANSLYSKDKQINATAPTTNLSGFSTLSNTCDPQTAIRRLNQEPPCRSEPA